jgi:hypothetical protein
MEKSFTHNSTITPTDVIGQGIHKRPVALPKKLPLKENMAQSRSWPMDHTGTKSGLDGTGSAFLRPCWSIFSKHNSLNVEQQKPGLGQSYVKLHCKLYISNYAMEKLATSCPNVPVTQSGGT